ncbi:uncharacterized protein N7482_001417 [Penicillium canariense]|uniref:Uncharacterized protein n=1 Tax=Penicillium canariense TaxID=189055 RepID=A0A9W9IGL1_9EURO|nr:uncharacterized protein N7482_001417 [Penicillium canariense]KAJ5175540.1 hypothetical protein N7482_001417 [Penicillium canariense]
MRYENWDILLFPEGCRVPIQEFKTQCFVTKDIESPYLQNPTIITPNTYYPVQGSYGQIPILTTFVPSLPRDSPFRVSIHSWEKPRPSRFTERLMQPDDVLLYEARVFVDGSCVAGGVFGQRAAWPYVLNIDREGNHDCLRFPPFHAEVLDQRHWNAADTLGRIRVVLAEGFARPNRSPPFERVKDVIVLSFQHAPLHILEYSKIAWPNPGMWSELIPRTAYKFGHHNSFLELKEPENTHGHSPSKSDIRDPVTLSSQSSSSQPIVYNNAWASGRAFPVPMSQWHPHTAQNNPRDPRWGGNQERYQEPFMIEPAIDPFGNEAIWHHRGARSSREDIPMPDYSSSSSSRAISSMTGISYEHSKQPSMTVPMDDDQYNLLIDALTPTKPPAIGTRAPSNTPSTMAAKPSAVPQAPRTSNSHGASRGSALREISQSSTREVSGSSLTPSVSNTPAEKDAAPSKIGASPSGNVKSRKEGSKENSEDSPKKSSPAKGNDLVVIKKVILADPKVGGTQEDVGEDKENTNVVLEKEKEIVDGNESAVNAEL